MRDTEDSTDRFSPSEVAAQFWKDEVISPHEYTQDDADLLIAFATWLADTFNIVPNAAPPVHPGGHQESEGK